MKIQVMPDVRKMLRYLVQAVLPTPDTVIRTDQAAAVPTLPMKTEILTTAEKPMIQTAALPMKTQTETVETRMKIQTETEFTLPSQISTRAMREFLQMRKSRKFLQESTISARSII